MSPLRTECCAIFAPRPGAREVMTQVERLSSRDTKIALRSVRIAACSSGRGQRACMGAPEWVVQHPHSAREQGATNRAHGIFKPAAVDLDGARRLLAEAGYPQGFGVGLDCSNDRYVNDEAICQAIVGMLARIGVRVSLNAQPKAKFFAKVLASGGYDTSFYLLDWTPNSFDSWNVFATLLACRDDGGTRGPFNLGGYCNPALDAPAARILVETEFSKRDAMIREAWTMERADVSHIPLISRGSPGG